MDRAFGEKLAELEPTVPVWIVDTPSNKAVARRLWSERPERDYLTGITTFRDFPTMSSEELFLSQVDTINLHHGLNCAKSPYTTLEVIGVLLSEKIRTELSDNGFGVFHCTTVGFTAERLPPEVA